MAAHKLVGIGLAVLERLLGKRDPTKTADASRSATQANGIGIEYQDPSTNRLPYVQNWNFGFQYQYTPPSTSVPAPATLALFGLGALGLYRRRRAV